MQWVLRQLNKLLTDERKWLRLEDLGSHDVKYKHGARMAKERIPQLEAAIKILGDSTGWGDLVDAPSHAVSAQAAKPTPVSADRVRSADQVKASNQLTLFQPFNP